MDKKTGDLPHLTFCEHEPKNLGTELKMLNDVYSGVTLTIEIMRGCFPMRQKRYVKECGVNGGILVRLTKNAMKENLTTYHADIENMTTPLKALSNDPCQKVIVTNN